ncbi:MAG: Mrp/NBP35 family ATP-binding protein [Verrucomicrobiia bacterium]|jgi:ATP-binding protein involved in chromosome partitioning
MLSEETILETLKGVNYPGYSRDIVSFGLVKKVAANSGAVSLELELTTGDRAISAKVKADCEAALKQMDGVNLVSIQIKQPPPEKAGATPGAASAPPKISGIKRIVAIASGKGGVGKSTCSVNLACGLQSLGARVGLLDCDIYGPSIPLMMGIKERPQVSDQEKLIPPNAHGIKLMSMGFLLDGDQPVIWRGPMIMKTIQQFISQVEWGELDYLLVDLPPGTGDAQLSLCQTVPLDGGVIITTPQEASLGVVRKGIGMFEKVNVPILGIVENMSYYTTPTGDRVEIFGHGGGKAEAERQKTAFLGEIPIFTEIREAGDTGEPVVVSAPNDPPAQCFLHVCEELRKILG